MSSPHAASSLEIGTAKTIPLVDPNDRLVSEVFEVTNVHIYHDHWLYSTPLSLLVNYCWATHQKADG